MKIILLSGKAGSGKSTTMQAICEQVSSMGYIPYRFRFAEPVYRLHNAVLQVLSEDYDIERGPKDRRLLQLLGTEYGRMEIHPNIWVTCALTEIQKKIEAHYDVDDNTDIKEPVFICDDMRFKNEADGFNLVIPGLTTSCYRVRLEAAEDVRKARADKFPEDTLHASETDLDGYMNWSMIVRTDGLSGSPQKTAKAILDVVFPKQAI